MEAKAKTKVSGWKTSNKTKSKWGIFTKERPLRVGTDCSGIEAPIVALKQLGVPFSHEFSSEVDKHCVATIRANFAPKIIFEDMTKRHVKDIPDIDLYVCGFPCQPFSVAGKREGVRDPRGTIFWECVQVIKHKKPMVFILENVKGLLSIDGGETFKQMMRELERIKGYVVQWKVLNTADHGIPQSRKRVFIVGLRKQDKQGLVWPEVCQSPPVQSFVDEFEDGLDETLRIPPCRMMKLSNVAIPENACFVDLSYHTIIVSNSHKVCPTIMARGELVCIPKMRKATISEYLRLQGFPTSMRIVVSHNQLKKQVGNSMSVNVLMRLLENMIKCFS